MGINEHLAEISNYLIYGAIAVYTLAMIAYAAEWAIGGRRAVAGATETIDAAETSETAEAGVVATLAAAETRDEERVALAEGGDSSGVAVLTKPRTEAAGDDVAAGDDDGDDADDVDRALELPTSAMANGNLHAETAGRIAVALTVLGFILHFGSVLTRGLAAHRAPWGNLYEFSTAGTLVAMGVYVGLVARQKARWLGLFIVTAVLIVLGLAVTVLYVDAEQLVPALHSYWLVIHVTAAVISSGGFMVGTLATALFLVKDAHDRGRLARFDNMLRRMPTAELLDRTAYRIYAFTFPLWTFTIIAGSIWAENAWGRYWGWDPTETWAFITWVVFAAYLHARATRGWKGRAAAIIALIGFGCFLFNEFGVSIFINGLHSYAGTSA
jgi:cytochrome c-type biogenesis protein CcsB